MSRHVANFFPECRNIFSGVAQFFRDVESCVSEFPENFENFENVISEISEKFGSCKILSEMLKIFFRKSTIVCSCTNFSEKNI
jgi:hypothetical protein